MTIGAERDPALARFSLVASDRSRLLALALDGLTLAVTAAVFLVLDKRFFCHGSGYDEEYFTWAGWCVTKGLAPYRDFLDFKPPMVFITHALAIALFGLQHFGFRTFFTVAPLAAVLLVQVALIRRGTDRVFALATVNAYLVLLLNPVFHDTALSDAESIVSLYFMLGLAAFLWQGRHAAVETALGGFFMSCAVFSKEPSAAVVAPAWFGMFWLRGETSSRDARAFVRRTALGVACFLALLVLYMAPTGALASYVDLIHAYPRIFRDPKTSYCVALGIAHPDDGFGVAWRHLRAVFLNQATLGHIAPFAVAGAVVTFRRSRWLLLSVVVAMAGGLWAGVATNCMWIHWCVVSMTAVLYLLVVTADSLRAPLASARGSVRSAACALAVAVVGVVSAPVVLREYATHYERAPWLEPQPGLLDFIARNTGPSDRIFTTGTPALYARADRLSAAVETAIIDEVLPSYPGATDEERLRPIREQLVKNRPKIVFLDPEHEYRKRRHLRALVLPFLRDFNYRQVNGRLFVRP
jgi:hypothetical protein